MNPYATPGSGVRSPAMMNDGKNPQKPPFRRAVDDTKPFLHDPISRSDPMRTEEAVLRLPPVVTAVKSSVQFGAR